MDMLEMVVLVLGILVKVDNLVLVVLGVVLVMMDNMVEDGAVA